MSVVGFGNLCAFMMCFAVGIFVVGMPYLVIEWVAAKAWHLGLIAGLAAATYTGVSMLAGRLAEKYRRHHVMAAGALLLAVAYGLMIFAPSIWFVMGLVVLAGLAQAIFWPALEAHLSHGVGPTELRNRLGWFNLWWSTADTVGAFVGGGLFGLAFYYAGRWGNMGLQAAPCLVSSGIAVAIVVIVLVRLHTLASSGTVREVRDESVPKSPGRGGQASLAVFWTMALTANCAAMALRSTMQSIFPEFGKTVMHYSQFQWGVLLGTMCLMRTLGFVYWQRRHNWEYQLGHFFWFQALLPLTAIILIFSPYYWLFLLAFALAGVGSSKTYFASLFYSLDSEHSHQHRSGVHEAVLGGGMVLPMLAGILASGTGQPRSPYMFMLAILGLGLLIQVGLYRRSRRANG